MKYGLSKKRPPHHQITFSIGHFLSSDTPRNAKKGMLKIQQLPNSLVCHILLGFGSDLGRNFLAVSGSGWVGNVDVDVDDDDDDDDDDDEDDEDDDDDNDEDEDAEIVTKGLTSIGRRWSKRHVRIVIADSWKGYDKV